MADGYIPRGMVTVICGIVIWTSCTTGPKDADFSPAPVSSGASDEQMGIAEDQLTILKRHIAEHDRRISALENALHPLRQRDGAATVSAERVAPPTVSGAPLDAWTISSNWDKVRDGMSQRQVTAILGEPTSILNVSWYRTLFYRGDVPGSGFVSGNVQLSDDRVWMVNKPVF